MDYIDYIETPIGLLTIMADKIAIQKIEFTEIKKSDSKANNLTNEAVKQLSEYFNKNRQEFNLPLNVKGTNYQTLVWNYLQNIKFGETVSYLNVAQGIGNPKSMRAVGNANGKNPYVIVIPCHRIIANSGQIGGYSAGIWRKEWLLDFENNPG